MLAGILTVLAVAVGVLIGLIAVPAYLLMRYLRGSL